MRAFPWSCLLLAAAIARADDTGLADCGKNHLILDDPAACWQETAPLHVARVAHSATLLLDGRVLVAGGMGEAGTSAEIYDPSSGRWMAAAPLHLSRVMHTATRLVDGRVLVVGGHGTYLPATGTYTIDGTAEIYDPVADTWTSVPGPLTPRDSFSATLLVDGQVLVVGGIDAWDNVLGTCELYDPATGQWTETGSLPDPGVRRRSPYWYRWAHTATSLADGRVLLAGGFADDEWFYTVGEAELYDPATGLWTAAGRLTTARAYHTASLLPDGRVMVAGGDWRTCPSGCDDITVATTEVYDPRANAWSAGPQMLMPRSFHAATPLRDGSLLLVGGGRSASGIPDSSMVLLGAAEESPTPAAPWAAAPSLRKPRYGHTATLLGDGSVLVVGGSADTRYGTPGLNSAEIYRPAYASTP